MGIKLLLIFSVVFCISQLPYTTYGACSDYELCGNCLSPPEITDKCGWCADDQTCRNGTNNGPSDGFCNNWIGFNTECPAPTYKCSDLFDDCVTCSSFSDCGWCETTGKCDNGGPGGPSSGKCDKWEYDFSECTAGPQNCSEITDCYVCTSADTCGWCAESQKCMRGYIGGPVEQTCSDSSWTFYPFQCEPFIPPEFHHSPCDERHSCETCSQEPGCGWCQETQKCLPGNEKNPLIGTCKDWKFNCGERPPSLKDCGDENTCVGCTTNPYNCSWCEDTNVCRKGRSIPNCSIVHNDKSTCPIPIKKSSKWWIGLIIVLVIGVVAGVGFYIYKTRFSGPKPPHGSFRLGDQIEDNDVYDDTDDDDIGDDLDNDITETDTRVETRNDDDFNPRQQDSLI